MKIVRVATEPAYEVRIGRGLLASVAHETSEFTQSAIVTDRNVARLYSDALAGLENAPRLAVEPGEASKSLVELERVLDFMAESSLDRESCLITLGGGVVGDLGGLAASIFMRGIAFVQVPTTLLAQVDASVGGKTAINLRAGKNLAGTIHQPSLVITDTSTLATLDDDEYRSGLGEVVKSALIEGEHAIVQLESEVDAIARRDPDVLAVIVEACVRTKASIVARDPYEHGERKKLNLGHTFAHAIEHAAGYGKIPHGIAVATGTMLALQTSGELGLLADRELPARVACLLDRLLVPHEMETLRAQYACRLAPDELLAGLRHDKKRRQGRTRCVLPRNVGAIEVDVDMEPSQMTRLLSRL